MLSTVNKKNKRIHIYFSGSKMILLWDYMSTCIQAEMCAAIFSAHVFARLCGTQPKTHLV